MEILLYIGAFFGFMAWMLVMPSLALPGRIAALEKEVEELRAMIEPGKQDKT